MDYITSSHIGEGWIWCWREFQGFAEIQKRETTQKNITHQNEKTKNHGKFVHMNWNKKSVVH